MYFTISTNPQASSELELAPGFILIPSQPLTNSTPEQAPAIARALVTAQAKAAPAIATNSRAYLFGKDAEKFGITESGFINTVTNDEDLKSEVIGKSLQPDSFGPFGEYILELAQEYMMERYGLPNLITQPTYLDTFNLKHSLASESTRLSSGSHSLKIDRLTDIGELIVGLTQRSDPSSSFPMARMLELIKRNGISGINQEVLSAGDRQLAELLMDDSFSSVAMDALLRVEELAEHNRSEVYGATSRSSVYWGKEKVGETYRKPGSFDIQFESRGLQTLLGEHHSSNQNTETPPFILNWQPDEVAGDPRFLEKAFAHGIYGLGNMAVLPNSKKPRVPDIQGVSIGAAAGADKVFAGAVLNIMRPSLAENDEQRKADDVRHEQFEPDKDEITLSGAQLKTAAYVTQNRGQFSIVKATLKDPTTHLVKIPRDSVSFRSSFGALEWLSMRLARSGGLDIPEFALIDFNKASRKYVRGEYAPAMENESGDVNLATLDLKRSIMNTGNAIGNSRMDSIRPQDEGERTAGDVIEPPGFIIERFDLPKSEDERVMGVDFATLMGIAPSQKFKMTYEDAALALRRHSSDFDRDAPALLSRIMGSWMLVDSDLHMKNLSVLATSDKNDPEKLEVRLSPAYDIVSVAGVNQVAHEGVVTLNGKRNPSLNDFVDFGVDHLDLSENQVRDIAHRMATGIHREIEAIRGAPMEAGYTQPQWPGIINGHRSVKHTLNQTLDAVEVNLALKGVLPAADARNVIENIQSGNPSAYATMEVLNEQQQATLSQNDDMSSAPFSI